MDSLPDEILEEIFIYLSGRDLIHNCSTVCKRWNEILYFNEYVWKKIVLKEKIEQENEIALLYDDFSKKYGLWKTYYWLNARRHNNWRKNNFRKFYRVSESWYHNGWTSFQNICVVAVYSSNTIEVLRVTLTGVLCEQQINFPVPGFEPTLVNNNSQDIIVVKSNIAVLYKKNKNYKYVLSTMFACQLGEMTQFLGDPENEGSVVEFVRNNYVQSGLVRVIMFEGTTMWFCDYNNSKLYMFKDKKINLRTWHDSFLDSSFQTAAGHICFWTYTYLTIHSLQGDVVFELVDTGLERASFNESFICIKYPHRVVAYNLKKRQLLSSIPVASEACMIVRDDSVIVLEISNSSITCYGITDGVKRWHNVYAYYISHPQFIRSNFQLSVILNKFLLVHSSPNSVGFVTIDIETGQKLYTINYSGNIVEISDRFLVILRRRSFDCEHDWGIHIKSFF